MNKRVTIQQAYDQLLDAHNALVTEHNNSVADIRALRKTVKEHARDIEYLKRVSRGPGARR